MKRKMVKLFPKCDVKGEEEVGFSVKFERRSELVSIRAFSPYQLESFRILSFMIDGKPFFDYDLPATLFGDPMGFALNRYRVPEVREEVFVKVQNTSLATQGFELLAVVEEDFSGRVEDFGPKSAKARVFDLQSTYPDRLPKKIELSSRSSNERDYSSNERDYSSPSADFEDLLDELQKVSTSLYFAAPEDHRRFHERASAALNKLANMLGLNGKVSVLR